MVLVFAAYRLFWYTDETKPRLTAVPRLPALLLGAALGFVSGLTGIGGLVGSELGVRRFAEITLRRLLAFVLLMAGVKLLLDRR